MARYMIDNIDAPIDWQEDDAVRRTLQNAKNLLMCQAGEVPYDRQRGFDPALYDLPMPALRDALLPEIDRLLQWEPDAEAVEAEATLRQDGGLYIKVVLELPW